MMKKLLCSLALLAAVATAAVADNYRCPNGAIVSTGQTMSEVAIKCDPPSFKNSRTESEGGYKGATILINVEEWTYNEGPHRLIHMLVFRNGRLEEVQTMGYGK